MSSIPYTYKLIFKPTGQYYYGVRWAKNCHPSDLWVKYFTSSKHIKKLIKEYGKESFVAKVTKTFKNKEDAGKWEQSVLERVNANRNGKMLNKSINMPVWDARGLTVIHHIETHKESFHDKSIKLPEGWAYGQSPSHIEKAKRSREYIYADPNFVPWNKGGGKSTGPCTEKRRAAIKESRLKTTKQKCQHCGKKTDPGNFKQFHGDNCKHNPNIDPIILERRSIKAKNSIKKQKETGTFSKPKAPVGVFKCPHCKKESSNYGAMKRHHFDRCKFKES